MPHFLLLKKPGLFSLGHTCSRTFFYQSSNLMFLLGLTQDFFCKESLCVLEISTTSLLHFFQRDAHFPPAAQINFPLPAHPGHGWQRLHHRSAKCK